MWNLYCWALKNAQHADRMHQLGLTACSEASDLSESWSSTCSRILLLLVFEVLICTIVVKAAVLVAPRWFTLLFEKDHAALDIPDQDTAVCSYHTLLYYTIAPSS